MRMQLEPPKRPVGTQCQRLLQFQQRHKSQQQGSVEAKQSVFEVKRG